MSLYKRGNVYWYKFMWQGKAIRESTKQGNDKTARKMEAAHRTALAQGLVGIREKKTVPTLADFLKQDFLPFVQGRFAAKPNTRDYYEYAAESLSASRLGKARLDEITSQHAAAYCAAHEAWSPSTINRDLRTLRRALNLAVEWGKLDGAPKITLARGEHQRERVLSADEVNQYLEACRHPDWHDAALVAVGTGMRPDDAVCSLRWEFIQFNGDSAKIRLTDAKSLAGRRVIPVKSGVYRHFGIPDVCAALKKRHEAQGCPSIGWVFPRPTKSGHLTEDSHKDWHSQALQQLARDHAEDPNLPEVAPFEPYCLRHTFLTWLAPKIDIFALARLAGHASIRTTQRYVHPAEKTLEDGLAQLAGGHKIGHTKEAVLTPRISDGATSLRN